jgi:glycosyltransferase involved in cell wall biosynthesis
MERPEERFRGLAFHWHPPEGGYSGGLLLTRRFFEIQNTFEFRNIVSDSTDLIPNPNLKLVRIPERFINTKNARFHVIVRSVNWAFHAVASFVLGLWHARSTDFIFVPNSEVPCSTAPAFLVALLSRKPLFLLNLNLRGTQAWWMNRHIHRHATRVMTISRALSDELAASIPRNDIVRFPLGVDDFSIPKDSSPKYDAIYVGRHVPEKGIDDLIAIWRRCCDVRPNLRLAMVGPCSASTKNHLMESRKALGLSDNIDFLGPLDESEKWQLYASSRVCAFPSHVEGWGLVPLEALLAGLPVVAFSLSAYEEHIARSPFVTLVDEQDLDGFAAAIITYVAAPPDAVATAEWARPFSWQRAIRAEENLLQEALQYAAALRPASRPARGSRPGSGSLNGRET